MRTFVLLVTWVMDTYVLMIVASAVLNWLASFDVVNLRNRYVRAGRTFLLRVTEPASRPVRAFLPDIGGVDLSPLVLVLVLVLTRKLIWDLSGYGT